MAKEIAGAAIVIFGATGDLAKRKLSPALYHLAQKHRLPEELYIIGFARRDWTDEYFRDQLEAGLRDHSTSKIPPDQEVIENFTKNVKYLQSTFEDVSGYEKLKQFLTSLEIRQVIFYLATPPDEYETIIHNLGGSGINQLEKEVKIVIEKPFGTDLTTAVRLDSVLHSVFQEKQIYRIDHYLGKDTVQNILVLRFANGIFEPLWNRNYVDHVQILVAEDIGIGSRGAYYEKAGVIRDVFQNHLLQLLALTAMEAPSSFNADALRDEKVKVLSALRPLQEEQVKVNTFRAQYVSGVINGSRVPGYKDEGSVEPSSVAETLMAARLFVDNWRWAGVPFYLLSGKRLPKRITQIAIQFKQVPLSLFNWGNMAGTAPNVLLLNLQPDESITLTFGVKAPGPIDQIAPSMMKFDYQSEFGIEPPDAYERLLLDAFQGDAALFTRTDEVIAQWAFTQQIIDAWKTNGGKNLPVYEAGTWGPQGLEDFITRDNRKWKLPDDL